MSFPTISGSRIDQNPYNQALDGTNLIQETIETIRIGHDDEEEEPVSRSGDESKADESIKIHILEPTPLYTSNASSSSHSPATSSSSSSSSSFSASLLKPPSTSSSSSLTPLSHSSSLNKPSQADALNEGAELMQKAMNAFQKAGLHVNFSVTPIVATHGATYSISGGTSSTQPIGAGESGDTSGKKPKQPIVAKPLNDTSVDYTF